MENEKDQSVLVSDYAIENFKNGLNCAESVYEALLKTDALEDIDKSTVAMCLGFGGGVGLSGCMCGALSAAIMANGAKYGRPDPWSIDESVRGEQIAQKYYRRYNNIIHEFIDRNGSAICAEISAQFDDFKCHERKVNCLKLIGATATLAYKYLRIPQSKAEKLPYRENLGGNV